MVALLDAEFIDRDAEQCEAGIIMQQAYMLQKLRKPL